VDDVESANAYAGAVLRRAGVTIAISTAGQAPALAGLLREGLELLLPHDLDVWVACARDARRRWLETSVPMEERRPLLLDALVALYDRRVSATAGGRV
jgi:uroporphyrin-III C-methyltransferase/precorrin-2 dehydrogenase/sirohydrochlorin ferrochelatase